MKKNWKIFEYLKEGNNKQKLCYELIKELKIDVVLSTFNPVIAGTIPIEVDIDSSDIDILCEISSFDDFKNIVLNNYSHYQNFNIREKVINNRGSVIVNFKYKHMEFEIFGQSLAVELQDGFRHMIVEDRIINICGEDFKNKIIELKKQGIKTEPAFGIILNIKDDPYLELLKLYDLSENELRRYLLERNN